MSYLVVTIPEDMKGLIKELEGVEKSNKSPKYVLVI
jgi:hypothetical protein